MKSYHIRLLLIMLVIGLASCKKMKNNNYAVADVYVKSISMNGNTAFGVEHFVKSASPMRSATVTLPDGASTELYPFDQTNLLFTFQPSINEGTYSPSPPAGGLFSYKVVFSDGEEKVFSDVLANEYLLPPHITSIAKTDDNQKVRLSFDVVTGADYYRILIYFQGDLIYISPLEPPPSGNNYEIPLSVLPSFLPGTYTYELDAVKFQSLNTGQFQALSKADIEIEL